MNLRARIDDSGKWGPLWLGLLIVVGYLSARVAHDALFVATVGFPAGFYPFWQSRLWWPELVNALQLGFIPAALMMARRGIARDLGVLAPALSCNAEELADIRVAATRTTSIGARAFKLSALIGAFALVFTDPAIAMRAEPSLTHPAFVWSCIRVPTFVWLFSTLIVADFNSTRTYYELGRGLTKVDLLDVPFLSPFARKGLRSALMWVLFSILLSLFWLGDGIASPQNFPLLIVLLSMASAAFVVPLIGVHASIRSAKQLELGRVRELIRAERGVVVDGSKDQADAGPNMANLVSYYLLIDRTREWPIDAVNLLRFFMYLLIGLGSWLGGAVVELMLDSALSS